MSKISIPGAENIIGGGAQVSSFVRFSGLLKILGQAQKRYAKIRPSILINFDFQSDHPIPVLTFMYNFFMKTFGISCRENFSQKIKAKKMRDQS